MNKHSFSSNKQGFSTNKQGFSSNKQSFPADKQSFSTDKDGQKVWGDVLSALKVSVSASCFKTWFSGSYVMDSKPLGDKKVLVVGVKSGFLKEQIEKRYMTFIDETLRSNNYGDFGVVFVVSQRENGHAADSAAPLFSGTAPSYISTNRGADALNSGHIFANFMVGPSNNIAHLAAVQVAANLGKSYNPLVLWGPTGVGKTHLMHAIGNEVLTKYENAKVLYVTSEKFTNDYLESLANHTQSGFRNKYRSVHLLLFDDVQFLAGKESTQDEFFHTFNELVISGRQVVVVSDKHPRELGKLKDRLVSRFLGGMCADVGYPDIEMKTAIVASKCRERGIVLADDVVNFIATECRGGARELEGVLTNVLAQMRLSGQLSTDSLKNYIGKQGVNTTVSQGQIVEAVTKHFKTRYSDLKGSSRRAGIVWARQVAMYLMRNLLQLPYEAIGDFFGGRDHSTVMHSIVKVEGEYDNKPTIRDDILRIKGLLGV